MAQFDGLTAGFAAYATEEEKSGMDLYLLNSVGDLETLNGLYRDQPAAAATGTSTRGRLQGLPTDRLDCSALIRLTEPRQLPGGSVSAADVLAGHTTWRSYYAMLRVYKVYSFDFNAAATVSIASSPGLLHSKDDFYATPTMVVMETTNGIYNRSLYRHISAQTALSWQRAALATAAARSGREWTQLFAIANSGTYNNQWMVLDLVGFQPGAALPSSGLLWVLEQIPGTCQAADVTDVLLQRGYWPSYNIPYFPAIFNQSGYAAEVAKWGPGESYAAAPRALIFDRNATEVNSLADFKTLMRYNRFQTDPVCRIIGYGGGACAVSARGDLPAMGVGAGAGAAAANGHGWLGGGVDAKVTAASMMSPSPARGGTVVVDAVCGPTHDDQPVFTWDRPAYANVSRVGLPASFPFGYVSIRADA